MTIKTTIAAAVIGLATITGANAAPLAAPAIQAEASVTEAGYHGGRGHGHRHRRYHKPYYGGHHVYYKKRCFKKKVRVWSHYRHGWVYKFKTVCYRGGHH